MASSGVQDLMPQPPQPPMPQDEQPPVRIDLPYSQHKWVWRSEALGEHVVNYATLGCGPPVVLVHGFGLASFHYRKLIVALAKAGYKVYAPDLLGFGASAKPSIPYSIEVWASLVRDFMAEFTAGSPATLVGNSVGGFTCVMAAATAAPGSVRGVVLLNTAGAMNNKGLLGDWRITLVYPLLLLIDYLLSIPAVSKFLFERVRSRDNIRAALTQVYCNKEAVTEELVELVYGPSCDANARDVFVSVITGPPGPKILDFVALLGNLPLLTLWGDQDKLTPVDGPVGKFFAALPESRADTTFHLLPDVGHALHDDKPEVVLEKLVPWLAQLHAREAIACPQQAAAP